MTTVVAESLFDGLSSKDITPFDRCDRCGAQAWMRAFKEDSELFFCGHHGNKHFVSLFSQGFIVQDDTYRM